MTDVRHIAESFAEVLVATAADPPAIVARCEQLLGRRYHWLIALAERYTARYPPQRLRPRKRDVVNWLLADTGFERACMRYRLRIKQVSPADIEMAPIAAAVHWPIECSLHGLGQLCDWLHLLPGDLQWYVDAKRLSANSSVASLWHYHYRILAKRFGQVRLIESPKPRLKAMQAEILEAILNHVPPHAAAHGFRQRHSIRTFAAPHVGHSVVIKLDLCDFFPSVRLPHVRAIFRAIGYPEPVSDALAGLCTTVTPWRIWEWQQQRLTADSQRAQWFLYSQPHLPQGAPTSPALANLAAYRLDCRLTGLAQAAGARYSRYADDLAFSGDQSLARFASSFITQVMAIVQDEGFRVNYHKTRVMRHGTQQRIAGVVVNQRINGSRGDFDRLKATLVNCLRLGPATQNRDAHANFRSHLQGRISHWTMLNPQKGQRLTAIFDQIRWAD